MSLVLLVDDSPLDRKLARHVLEHEGLTVAEARDGHEALRSFFELRPDLVVLDVLMPSLDGWLVCSRIRELAATPIIMLTSLDREEEMIRGLDLGADDFLSKPVSPRHLAARVRAVLRRIAAPEAPGETVRYDDGDLQIDEARHVVRCRGAVVDLTPTEFRLLVALARSPGAVQGYATLLSTVWGPEYVDDRDFLRVYIWRLRKKLEANPAEPCWLLTERGFGYRFGRPSAPSPGHGAP